MLTILLTWEQGGGLGHIIPLLPVAAGLANRGHRVFVAVRDLSRARSVFSDERIHLLQPPQKNSPPQNPILPSFTLAHIFHNIGYGDLDELASMADAWSSLYNLINPDLILFDHSPTALLAARGLRAKKALIGHGFCAPPDVSPLPNLCTWLPSNPQELLRDEMRVLDVMNQLLGRRGQRPMERIPQMYREADEKFLTILQELDHYPNRKNARHWGPWHQDGGAPPRWPQGRGRKIYAYLQAYPELPHLMGILADFGQPTLVYIDSLHPQNRASLQAPNILFGDRRLNICPGGAEYE